MKKTILLAAAALLLILTSCDKWGYTAQYSFNVSDKLETKAILNSADESGIDITWEEGDEISVSVEVYADKVMMPISTASGKLVYENGDWTTYVAKGRSYTKAEYISVNSTTLNCKVRMRYLCLNGDLAHGDPNAFDAEWVRTYPFAEGAQSILITLPF